MKEVNFGNFFAIDRRALLFNEKDNRRLLSALAGCSCIERKIKAVMPEDAIGANIIVISREKFDNYYQNNIAKKEKIMRSLERTGAIRDDVLEYSEEISLEEEFIRNSSRSRFEVEAPLVA